MIRRSFFRSVIALFALFFLPAPSVPSYAELAKTFVWTTKFGMFPEIGPVWLMTVSGWMPDGIEYHAGEYVKEEEDCHFTRATLGQAMRRRYDAIVEA